MTAPAPLPPPTPLRQGIALTAVVLITVALVVLAHAALLLSHAESMVARADARRVEGGYQAAANLAAAERTLDSLPGSGPLAVDEGAVEAVRLSGELVLLRATVSGVSSGETRARLLYAPDPAIRTARRRAGIVAGVGVQRAPGAFLGPAADRACSPEGPTLPGLTVLERAETGALHPALGPISLPELTARLPDRMPGTLAVDSTLVAAIRGNGRAVGEGRVVLAVEGDLVLGSGAILSGWVWVGGELVLQEGARFSGMADVGSILRMEEATEFHVDACAGLHALRAAPDLLRPWGVGPLAWPAQ